MNNLVQTIGREVVTSSRTIAEVFEKRHDVVLRAIENKIGSLPTQKCGGLFSETTYTDIQGKSRKEYLLNRDGFSFIVMGFTGEKADDWKLKYIEAFNRMETTIKEQKLEIDSNFMYQLAQKMEEKEKQIEEMKPKALFADAVTTSKSSILIGQLAKLIKQNGYDIGQNRLFKWLREKGYLIRRKGEDYNTPTQYSMEMGLMEIKKRTINNPDGSVKVTKTTKVTGKGQVYFINKFLNEDTKKALN